MKFDEIEATHKNISGARRRSTALLAQLQKSAPEVPPGVSIVVNGSLARWELTSQSDFDAYPLYRHGAKEVAVELFQTVRSGAGLKQFSEDGAFGSPVPASSIKRRIGGHGDDNRRFTRRMLLLLESVCIGEDSVYNSTIDELILRYLSNDMTEKQIGRFLLNDFIRFYRTMCVDFEFKTIEQPKPKPWGIRYTKLIFSRKLIYFSGVVMCASLAGLAPNEKRARLRELVAMPPVDRLLAVLGELALPALTEYDGFLQQLDDEDIRNALTSVEVLRETHTDLFKQVKASGHRFSTAVVTAFRSKYPADHPIREAILV